MTPIRTTTREDWLTARRALLEEEKALTRAREALAEKRRALPWVPVETAYEFEDADGRIGFADLFGNASQLIVQHFMFAPEWTDGCPICSFWADQFDRAVPYLAARNVQFVAVSQAPVAALHGYRARMGWSFPWVSAAPSRFSYDYHACCTQEQIAAGDTAYNYQPGLHYGEHAPGVSVFARDHDGQVYHTYSCYARGLDTLNGAYQLLDLVPRGRNEDDLPYPMAWVKRRDELAT